MIRKKLMILGGSRYAVPVVEAEHRLVVYASSPNAVHMVSGEYGRDREDDKDSVPETIQRLSGGGIVSFAHDSFILSVTCGV